MPSIISIKVTPRSQKNQIEGWKEGYLNIRLRAIPDKGAANDALIKFLADALDIPRSAIKIISGHTSRIKRVEIDLERDTLLQLLSLHSKNKT